MSEQPYPMKDARSIAILLLCASLVACGSGGSSSPGDADGKVAASSSATPPSHVASATAPAATTTAAASGPSAASPTSTAKDQDGHMDDLQAFATGGAKVLDSKTGDLNGDGKPDALLVIDPPVSGNEKLGEGPARTVLLLVRDAAGQLQKAAQNDKIVPCAQCGGMAGDPYSYSQLADNGFTIVTEGGSREHWSNEYSFAYASDQKDWLLQEVKREVADQETGKQKKLDLTSKDFGAVTFKDFDPSKLPGVELP